MNFYILASLLFKISRKNKKVIFIRRKYLQFSIKQYSLQTNVSKAAKEFKNWNLLFKVHLLILLIYRKWLTHKYLSGTRRLIYFWLIWHIFECTIYMVFQTKILQCQNTQVYVEGWHYLLTLSVSVYCFFIVLSIFYYLLYSTCLKQPLKQQKTSMGRISHRRCSVKKGVLGNFAKFTGKHLCQRLVFNKVAGHLSYRTPLDGSWMGVLFVALF